MFLRIFKDILQPKKQKSKVFSVKSEINAFLNILVSGKS